LGHFIHGFIARYSCLTGAPGRGKSAPVISLPQDLGFLPEPEADADSRHPTAENQAFSFRKSNTDFSARHFVVRLSLSSRTAAWQ